MSWVIPKYSASSLGLNELKSKLNLNVFKELHHLWYEFIKIPCLYQLSALSIPITFQINCIHGCNTALLKPFFLDKELCQNYTKIDVHVRESRVFSNFYSQKMGRVQWFVDLPQFISMLNFTCSSKEVFSSPHLQEMKTNEAQDGKRW